MLRYELHFFTLSLGADPRDDKFRILQVFTLPKGESFFSGEVTPKKLGHL